MLRIWHALIYLGDGAVLLPCAALVFAWLILAPATRRTGWWWLLAVLLVGGGAALSKMWFMATGWHPAGWNFIGLSGHASLAFLFWPSAAALVTSRHRAWLRVFAVAIGVGLALAITTSSWALRDHSLSELVLGALWGGLVAAIFLAITWRHVTEAPSLRSWVIVGLLSLAAISFGHKFPSASVLGWVVSQVNGHTAIHTRSDLGPWAELPKATPEGRRPASSATRAHMPQRAIHDRRGTPRRGWPSPL